VTPWVLRILIATVLMFFVQQTASGVTQLLYLVPTQVWVRPWTLVTYMFLHAGLGHIFWNMLGLYFFGPRVESRMGSSRFLTLYLVSGVVGALFSVVLAPRYPILGASGAVLVGHMSDTLGQRWVGIGATVLQSVGLLGFLWTCRPDVPLAPMLLCAGLTGFANPQVGAMARARWSQAAAGRADRQAYTSAAMAWEACR